MTLTRKRLLSTAVQHADAGFCYLEVHRMVFWALNCVVPLLMRSQDDLKPVYIYIDICALQARLVNLKSLFFYTMVDWPRSAKATTTNGRSGSWGSWT